MKTQISANVYTRVNKKIHHDDSFIVEADSPVIVDWDLELIDKNTISAKVNSIEGEVGIYKNDNMIAEEYITKFDISNIKIDWVVHDDFFDKSTMSVYISNIDLYCDIDIDTKVLVDPEITFISI